jgi:ATP-dependent RNA helicase RhlB
MTEKHLTETRFDSFDLPQQLLQGIEDAGFSNCTPIQEQTLPLVLAGKDCAGQAQTGTGKTAAFLLALFNRLLKEPPAEGRKATQPRALVLAPTRELAIQIWRDAEVLGKHTGLKLGLVYGGTGYESQREMLNDGIDVLIGTPGRIIDYFRQGIFDLKALQVLVLDEADRMFDLGFIKDIRFLLRRMPEPAKRLNMLFSATLSQRVLELAYEHMNEPDKIEIAPERVTADRVKELVYHTANEDKIPLLIHLLKGTDPRRSLVFVNTKRAADQIADWLNANGLVADTISGDVPQKKREKLLGRFQTGELPVLVATDVAARGLHIPDVSHVFNFDLPQDCEDYVHRIGRTARAGKAGEAISFGCEEYVFSLPDIEQYIGHKVPVGTVPSDLPRDGLVRPPRRPRKKPMGGGGRPGGGGRRQGGGQRRRA